MTSQVAAEACVSLLVLSDQLGRETPEAGGYRVELYLLQPLVQQAKEVVGAEQSYHQLLKVQARSGPGLPPDLVHTHGLLAYHSGRVA